MTGVGVEEPERMFVRSETRGILAFAEKFQELGFSCIGCGRCVDACPQGISPYFIYKMVRAHRSASAARDAADCTCCGSCSYVCPAKLDLSHTIYDCASSAKVQPRRMRA
jgi:Na+-translocating ferredoxin:NAD+ oxidoreductase subunit C